MNDSEVTRENFRKPLDESEINGQNFRKPLDRNFKEHKFPVERFALYWKPTVMKI